MRIYHREHAGRPLRAAWALEEAGQDYEIVKMTTEEGKGPEHRARHPLGKVPVLEDGDGFIFESAAIVLHIADSFPDANLIPPPGSHARALVYQWAVYGPAEMEPPLIESAMFAQADPERSAKARKRFDERVEVLAAALGEDGHLLGEPFTVADIMVGSALKFTARIGFAEELPEHLRAYMARLEARPAYERALARTRD
jgi:glutathione S-transferase